MATIWTGPVNLAQVGGAVVPGEPVASIACCGDTSPGCPPVTCGGLADGWLGPDGRRLPSILAARDLPQDEPVVFGAFSAGGSLVKRVLLSPADRAQTRAVMLADATYTNDLLADGGAAPIPGFVEFGVDALTKGKLFVATASSFPNKNWPDGARTLEATRLEIERRWGTPFNVYDLRGVISPAPIRAWRLGTTSGGVIIFADYGQIVTHGEHATLLAPQIWKTLLLPWLEVSGAPDGPLPVAASEGPWWPQALALVFGTGLGYAGARMLSRRL